MTLATDSQCSEATARALTDELRKATDSLTQGYQLWEGLVLETYQRHAWASLGYDGWDSYVSAEIPALRQLRLGRPERRELVSSLTEAGMSTRAIGSALGIGVGTVHRDQAARVPDGTPDEPVDAEIVDDLANEAARQFATSDADYARQAADMERELREERDAEQATSTVGPGQAPNQVLGTDGKTYNTTTKPAAQRRRPLPEQFWQASFDLLKVTDRIARLSEDDRFPRNAEEVAASHRNDLIRAIDALQGVVNRLPSA